MSRRGEGVLIMAGGTGGHIYPGLAVAAVLRARGIPVRWLGAEGGMECRTVPAHGFEIDVVRIGGVRGKGVKGWLALPFRLARAVSGAWKSITARRPACALSFGGYASGPGGLAARLRGIPLIVHEQNRVPGLTNRVLARLAQQVLQAFPGTFPDVRNVLTCGNPVRADVAALPAPEERLAGRAGPVRLLVTGGSQGARALNRAVPAALAGAGLRDAVEVRHQCGRRWGEETRAAYRAAGAEAVVSEFIDDMAEAYAWADLVVCRAGALTVSELAAAGVAAVLVPFPHAVDDHQTLNAAHLVEGGAAVRVPEDRLEQSLADTLGELVGDRARLAAMAGAARALAVPDSAEKVANVCMGWAAA